MMTFSDLTISEAIKHGVQRGGYEGPDINTRHIDGPLLYFSDGQLHWLTLLERIQLWFGMVDADKLQRKLRPRLMAELEVYWRMGAGMKSTRKNDEH